MTVQLGLEGVFPEHELPQLIRRSGMVDWRGDHVSILDRRKLPHITKFVDCYDVHDVAHAIKNMTVQGAFTISIVAGYGLALAAQNASMPEIESAAEVLRATRPTGLALNRAMDATLTEARNATGSASEAIRAWTDYAAALLARQGYETGKNAAALIPDGATILTHCFPDRSYAYMLLSAKQQGKTYNIICSETRPYLQGARLTALVASELGFQPKSSRMEWAAILCAQASSRILLPRLTGSALDGTVCNKIGTYQYALACADNDKPYITLRQSGPDPESRSEDDIEIEMRDGNEVVEFLGHRTAPFGVKGLYPTFDIIPPRLVTRIVTDRGVFAPTDIHTYFQKPEHNRKTET